MPIYERYAEIYDLSGQISFSVRMIPYLQEILEARGFTGQTMLDLACGTGTVAISFAQQGLRAYGVDASAAMLEQARAKAAEAGVAVEWSQQDMRDFTLPEPVDLVTCLYDSLNYMLSVEDLSRAFRRVAAALNPGGLFAFDVNTIWLYENIHAGGTFYSEADGLATIIQGTYDADKRQAVADIVGFVRRDALYERFAETHVQRAHTDDEIAQALAAAGLREEARYRCFDFKPADREAPKVMWVARKSKER